MSYQREFEKRLRVAVVGVAAAAVRLYSTCRLAWTNGTTKRRTCDFPTTMPVTTMEPLTTAPQSR